MNKMGFIIFFLIYFLLNFYIFIRGRQALPKEFVIQTIYTTVFLIFTLSFFVAVFLEGKIPEFIVAIGENIGGYWMITLLYFLSVVLLADIFRLFNYFFGIIPRLKLNYEQVKLMYFGAVILLLMIFSITGYIRYSNIKVVPLNVDVAVNSGSAKTLTIVAASDLHLGNVIRKKKLIKNVELINRQNPDIILLAGDLFDRNLHTIELQKMEVELRKLKARYGVYAVLGNHEYFGNVQKAMEIINRSGIKLLKDSVVNIDGSFLLIGRDDYTNRQRKPLKNILSNSDKSLPRILLDHQPVHLSEAVENNINLQLSGHTHNGQIYPMNKIVERIYELGYGYKKTGNTHFYVSSGIGLWGTPIRLGTQSEIVNIKMNFVPAL